MFLWYSPKAQGLIGPTDFSTLGVLEKFYEWNWPGRIRVGRAKENDFPIDQKVRFWQRIPLKNPGEKPWHGGWHKIW